MGWFCPRCGHDAAEAGACPRDAEPLVRVSTHDLLGRTVGEYKVLASLGGGSFGTVYRAVHVRSGLLVALKLLHQPISEVDGARVITEARAAAMLRHDRVVQVYDLAVTSDRRPYIVMQLLEGRSLASLLGERPLPVPFALALAADILSGLAAAHARGIVHRDLKPDNVFVAGGRAILVDFGLAKLVADPRAPNLTITGEAIGTPSYMSPEQIRGKPADARADLYAVACVLFEMLAGRPPFEGATFVLFDAHTSQPPPSIAALRPEVPAHVDAAITRALAKDPADRFPDAAAMQRALAGHAPARLRRWPFVAALVAALVVAGVIAAIAAGGDGAATPATTATPPDARRTIAVPPRAPGEPPLDPKLEDALAAIADAIDRGFYSRDLTIRMRCEMESALVASRDLTGMRPYYRRLAAMLDAHVPGIDLATACARPAPRPRVEGPANPRVPLPPALPGEPPLDADSEDTLAVAHHQLEAGTYSRAHAVRMMCFMHDMRRNRMAYDSRAFHRRYERLLRGYYPDLDAAECRAP